MINDEIIAMIVKTIIKTIRLKLIGLKIMRLKIMRFNYKLTKKCHNCAVH